MRKEIIFITEYALALVLKRGLRYRYGLLYHDIFSYTKQEECRDVILAKFKGKLFTSISPQYSSLWHKTWF